MSNTNIRHQVKRALVCRLSHVLLQSLNLLVQERDLAVESLVRVPMAGAFLFVAFELLQLGLCLVELGLRVAELVLEGLNFLLALNGRLLELLVLGLCFLGSLQVGVRFRSQFSQRLHTSNERERVLY